MRQLSALLPAAAGTAALDEADYYRENCRKIQETREEAVKVFEELGFAVVPSLANFLFVSSERVDGKVLYEKLKERKILIRHFDYSPKVTNWNRVTIGTPEEMQVLFGGIREILAEEA